MNGAREKSIREEKLKENFTCSKMKNRKEILVSKNQFEELKNLARTFPSRAPNMKLRSCTDVIYSSRLLTSVQISLSTLTMAFNFRGLLSTPSDK